MKRCAGVAHLPLRLDGPHVRNPVHATLRTSNCQHQLVPRSGNVSLAIKKYCLALGGVLGGVEGADESPGNSFASKAGLQLRDEANVGADGEIGNLPLVFGSALRNFHLAISCPTVQKTFEEVRPVGSLQGEGRRDAGTLDDANHMGEGSGGVGGF